MAPRRPYRHGPRGRPPEREAGRPSDAVGGLGRHRLGQASHPLEGHVGVPRRRPRRRRRLTPRQLRQDLRTRVGRQGRLVRGPLPSLRPHGDDTGVRPLWPRDASRPGLPPV